MTTPDLDHLMQLADCAAHVRGVVPSRRAYQAFRDAANPTTIKALIERVRKAEAANNGDYGKLIDLADEHLKTQIDHYRQRAEKAEAERDELLANPLGRVEHLPVRERAREDPGSHVRDARDAEHLHAHVLRDDAPGDVGPRAGGQRNDHPDGLGGIVLGSRDRGCGQQIDLQ